MAIKRIGFKDSRNELNELLKLWALRAFAHFNLVKKLDAMHYDEEAITMVGLNYSDYKDGSGHRGELKLDGIKSALSAKHIEAENKYEEFGVSLPKILSSNLDRLAKLTNIDEDERYFLAFLVIMNSNRMLNNLFEQFSASSSDFVIEVLSKVLNIDVDKTRYMLSLKSKLCQTGLISINMRSVRDLSDKIELLSSSFADKMLNYECDAYDLIKDFVRKCEPAKLTLKDYEHVDEYIKVLTPYLKKTIAKNLKGVNILVYGAPGTGKTEFVKAFASELDVTLAEISFADENEEPIESAQRLKALKIAQCFFADNSSLLMLDEAEDVFTLKEDNSNKRATQSNKALMNRALEQNQIPTFWVSNSIYGLDQAVLRRFDLCIEMPMPTKKKRLELVKKECGELIAGESSIKLASCEELSPAILAKASSVLKTLDNMGIEESSKTMELLIKSQMSAQGAYFQESEKDTLKVLNYDPKLINADAPLEKLRDGIKKTGFGRVCLYGPPGTGKSAFGRWLADELDRPLLLKKASDLISMYVGGTEKHIASAFREALDSNSVLVLDEVDSFLQDRRSAVRSWEITAVNEMLVQMENFKGVFIATTNLMEGLDQASLRRFDLKLKFNYLKPEQAFVLFTKHCENIGLKKPRADVKKRLESLTNLTPGDFAAVARQAGFNPIKNYDDLLSRLSSECEIKEDSNLRHKMGFIIPSPTNQFIII